MSVYAVASGKGGVGKTTTAVALGACLAGAGRRTVLVDADLAMPDLGTVLDVPVDGPSLHDILAGEASIGDVTRPAAGGIDVLPGGIALADYARGDPDELGTVVEILTERYDTIILDTAAGLSQDVLTPVGLADETILVTTPTQAAVQDTEKLGALVDRVDGTVAGVVVNRVIDADTADIEAQVSTRVLGLIPEDDAVPAAEQQHEPVTVYDPDGPAGSAYIEVTATVLGVPVGDVAPDEAAGSASPAASVPFTTDQAVAEGDLLRGGSSDTRMAEESTESASSDESQSEQLDDSDADAASSPPSLLSRLTGGLFG